MTGRILTVEECNWLSMRGFGQGYDVDTQDPQLSHITLVERAGELVRALCRSEHLWGGGLTWGHSRADGSFVERDRLLSCNACLAHFETLRERSDIVRRHGTRGNAKLRATGDKLKEFYDDLLDAGRPDLAALIHAIEVAWMVESQIDEEALRLVMRHVLSHKNKRIAEALDILNSLDTGWG
jgi:hypothetical protein